MISLQNIPQTSMDLLRLIIVNQMGLDPEKVNIYDEKWTIPPTEDLYIVLEYRSGKLIANRNTFVSTGGDPIEEQDINVLEQITIGVFSKDRSATQRKEEVFMALLSSYAQNLQEKYSFKISRIGPIVDLSTLEGVAMLKRYDIDISVFAWYEKTINPTYLDSFTIKVIDDLGNGKDIIVNIDQTLTNPSLTNPT